MIDGKRAFRRILICLIVMLAFQVAAAPVLQMNTTVAWAKSKKKTKKKAKAKKKKKTGFVRKNGNWYFLREGKKQTGWITFKGRRYFAYKKGYRKGRLVRGWFKRGKKEYYFRETGKKRVVCSMAINCTVKINGIKCVFDKNGKFVRCKNAKKKPVGFIETVGEMARLNQMRNNILASLVVAQACVETGYGANVYQNNLFGIYHGNSYGSYSSWEESLEDYVDFMETYIPSIFGVRDWSNACYIVGHSGYAAASDYYSALVWVVQNYNLTRFDK